MLTSCAANTGSAEGETVTLYGWGGDERVNSYIDDTLAPYVKETTGVVLKRVPMDAVDFMAKLTNETAQNAESDIDILWINGENFYSAKENGLLYGPFAADLENYKKYIDPNAFLTDFGYPVEGFEAPWGRAQFVMFYDSDKVTDPPKNAEALFKYVKENPGTFTYPVASDFTASAFIRTLIYDIAGYENVKDLSNDYDEVKAAMEPVTDFLNSIEPYLWKEGSTYPESVARLDSLYSDGEINFTMDYSAGKAPSMIADGSWSGQTRTFVFDSGTPFNTHFLAISGISSHKEAAMKVINAALSVKMQTEKADSEGWADLPVLDFSKLEPDEAKALEDAMSPKIEYAESVLSYDELDLAKKPELRSDLVDVIEKVWMDEVLYK